PCRYERHLRSHRQADPAVAHRFETALVRVKGSEIEGTSVARVDPERSSLVHVAMMMIRFGLLIAQPFLIRRGMLPVHRCADRLVAAIRHVVSRSSSDVKLAAS
ncbi:MAG: hypothetical protein ABR524_10470, partial [Thermoanaerobaculia bacterium]